MNPNQMEGRFERSLTVNGPVRLDIATTCGTTRISTGEAGTVRIRGILRANRSLFGLGNTESKILELEENPPVEQDGNDVRIRRVSSTITLLLDIAVPRDTTVQSKAQSGGIRIDGVQGSVYCSTDSGFVEVVNAGAGVRAEADSGRIEIKQAAGPVYAEVDSGDIYALEIGGAIEAHADSGDIRLTQTVPAAIRAKTDSGRIRVQLAPGAGYSVRVRADSGSIHVPELTGGERANNELYGDIRGGGPSVDVEADSGDIDVE